MKLALELLQDENRRLYKEISMGDATGIYTEKQALVHAAIKEIKNLL